MKRTERHHLKENELVHSIERAKESFEIYRKPIMAGAVALVAIILVVVGLVAWRSNSNSQSQGMLAEALAAESARIAPAPTPGSTTPAAAPAGTFASERARDEAALAKFMAVANAYPSSDAGITARYHAAALLVSLGRAGEAVQRYQEVIDKAGNSLYGEMAKLGQADAQAASGQLDKAIETYKAMSAQKDGRLPADGILMQLGRAYQAAGKTTDAKQTFKRVVDEFPTSLFSAEAKRQVDGMKG